MPVVFRLVRLWRQRLPATFSRLHSSKPACSLPQHIVPSLPLALPSKRPYCTLPGCLWPANLPPATEWGYGTDGPDTWASKYPQAGGKNQSPVNIESSVVQGRTFDQPLTWHYGPGICKSIVNTGCGWRVDIQGDDSTLSGGPLSHNYELVQFHSHWGNSNTCGSEHTVDGKSYAGELHFVHWNKELFASCAEAVPASNGLTVIGVFLEVGEKNEEVEKICAAISEIPAKDQRVDLNSDINPVGMFPADHSYWTYTGSLTTPPCYESVTWIMFKNPITVSQEQLNVFRQMKKPCDLENTESAECVDHNYRPPQLLNDREICECV